MKRIVSAALLLITLLAFTACDQTETSQSVSQSPTQTQPTVTATETPTQAPIVTVTPTHEITKVPTTTPTIKITPQPTESHPLKDIVIDTSNEYFGWVYEKGAGNPAHLAEAVRRIELYDNLASPYDVASWPEDPSEEQRRTVREVVTEHLRNILWDLDVYVDCIFVGGAPLGDAYDENGNWVPVEMVCDSISVAIALDAGDESAMPEMYLR